MNVHPPKSALFFDLLTTPIGELTLCCTRSGALCEIAFDTPSARAAHTTMTRDPRPLRPAAQQLTEYFAGTRLLFDLELAAQGTPFQHAVWHALTAIPYGATRSYGSIAKELGAPTAARAVGAANGRNPLPIVVPCHRVIGASGTLTGYAGGLPIKRFLLDLEASSRSVRSPRLATGEALRRASSSPC